MAAGVEYPGGTLGDVELPFILGGWRSTRPGRVSWTEQDVAELAIVMKSCLPPSLLAMVDDGTWPGSCLMVVGDPDGKPSAAEVAQNHCFLKPLVMKYPSKVPSGYFLTDAYLYLDLLLNKRLFKPKAADPKENKPAVTRAGLAGLEGVKAKKLLGGLRTLWRSSQVGAHDPRVVDLKNYLQPSPRKIPAALREDAEPAEPIPTATPEASPEPEPAASSPEGDGEESEKPEEDLSGSESLPESDDEPIIGSRDEPAATDSDSDSILSKKTLALGEPASSDVESVSVEREPDSQVSSGWLGQAYNRESRTQKKEKAKQDHREKLAQELIAELVAAHPEVLNHPCFHKFHSHCVSALTIHGDHVAEKLVSTRHFYLWARIYQIHVDKVETDSPGMDPVNAARNLMKMDADPCLFDLKARDEKYADDAMPPPKRAKTGPVVADSVLGQDLREAPAQTVSKAPKVDGAVTHMFRDYNLREMGVPEEAWPAVGGVYKGSKSFTIRSRSGAALEVLLSSKAFVIKKVGNISGGEPADEGTATTTRQITWSKHGGPAKAWQIAKRVSNFI